MTWSCLFLFLSMVSATGLGKIVEWLGDIKYILLHPGRRIVLGV